MQTLPMRVLAVSPGSATDVLWLRTQVSIKKGEFGIRDRALSSGLPGLSTTLDLDVLVARVQFQPINNDVCDAHWTP